MSKKSFEVTTLDNGLRVATDYLPEARGTSACWMLRAGSNYDRLGGEAHFLEHLLCSGHEGNPDFDLMLYTDNWGADTNFMTSIESTFSYINTLPRRLSEYLDILGKMVCHSLVAESELSRQRGIIRQEYLMASSNPNRRYFFNILQSLYGQAPFTRDVLGSLDSIMGITREDLLQYKEKHYLSEDMALFVSGPVPHDHVVFLAGHALSGIKPGKNPVLATPDFLVQKPINFHEERSSQKINIIYPVPHDQESNRCFKSLGRYIGTAINEHMRNAEITYNVDVGLAEFSGASYFYIEYETEPDLVSRSLQEIRSFMSLAANHIVEEKYDGLREVDEFYEAFKGDSPKQRSKVMKFTYEMTGELQAYEQIVESKKLATPQEARQALRNLLSLKPRILGMGPVDDLPDFSGPAHSLKNQFEPRNT